MITKRLVVRGTRICHCANTPLGKDVVYANLAGNLEKMATNIVEGMNATNLKHLIWISSMGIYNEAPGERYQSILNPYQDSVRIIEDSVLDYTILRPRWFTNQGELIMRSHEKVNHLK